MKTLAKINFFSAILFLLGTSSAFAGSVTTCTSLLNGNTYDVCDYKSDAYKYVNTVDTFLSDSDQIDQAFYWENINISDGGLGFTSNLNTFFSSATVENNYIPFTFNSVQKVEADDTLIFQNPIQSKIKGVLLKQATESLLVTFSDFTGPLYWNTLFADNGASYADIVAGGSTFASSEKISHYVLLDVQAVPIPAAAFLFAPALLGFMGLRRKAKNTVA